MNFSRVAALTAVFGVLLVAGCATHQRAPAHTTVPSAPGARSPAADRPGPGTDEPPPTTRTPRPGPKEPAPGRTPPRARQSSGPPAAPRHTARPTKPATAKAVRALAAGEVPGAAALTTRDGHAYAARFAAAGVADVRTDRPITPADHFRAGSLTKTFIATVVLQLTAEHRLSLDDTVGRLLPELTPGATDPRDITVRELLDHTSGLYNYTADPELSRELHGAGFTAHRYDTYTPDELLRTALGHPAENAPGDRYVYSNTNYLVLGQIIEAVTGHGYATEAEHRIITPLGLSGTSFPGTDPRLPRPYGRGYSQVGEERVDSTALDPSRAGAAGELVTTLGDLNRFFGALLGGRLLPPRQLVQMRDEKDTNGVYGLGLYGTRLSCGVTVWGHDGDINGSYAQTAATGDGRHVLTLRLNTDQPDAPRRIRALLTAEFCPRS
ncbi:serine hydrolase domain-containing protein [Streptomyces niger]|uniref:serine hydrolase domain-containing protein n=1 Tax=Streptomyces niger TaxID=66373 RepID=UPI001F2FCF5F|nr:serine hydrolase domain-containing protein [Streptomyces niger]